jgi:hypothetical protein
MLPPVIFNVEFSITATVCAEQAVFVDEILVGVAVDFSEIVTVDWFSAEIARFSAEDVVIVPPDISNVLPVMTTPRCVEEIVPAEIFAVALERNNARLLVPV